MPACLIFVDQRPDSLESAILVFDILGTANFEHIVLALCSQPTHFSDPIASVSLEIVDHIVDDIIHLLYLIAIVDII